MVKWLLRKFFEAYRKDIIADLYAEYKEDFRKQVESMFYDIIKNSSEYPWYDIRRGEYIRNNVRTEFMGFIKREINRLYSEKETEFNNDVAKESFIDGIIRRIKAKQL